MQQHTGEHIVSGIIHRMFGYHNVGFHVGGTMVTIDFDGMIPPESLAQIELEANEAIWKNLPVRTWVPSPEELSTLTYRSKRALPWPVRIVEVPGFDDCACCGVHVAHTGEVGLIKLCSMVKFHQGVRIEMVCGNRALQYLCAVYEQNRQVSQAFSAKLLETGEAARRMNEILAAEKYRAEGLQTKVFTEIAKSYVNQKHVLHFEQGLNPGSVRELADRIAAVCSGTAAVFSGSEEAGYSFCLMTRQGDLRQLGRDMTTALHGRGGGKPEFQQGSVKAGREEITAFFESCF
jgi:alanyl-tRNA synthetase